jgi:hypothetical protein
MNGETVLAGGFPASSPEVRLVLVGRDDDPVMSALPPKADITESFRHVR